jgi:hypothetical protein
MRSPWERVGDCKIQGFPIPMLNLKKRRGHQNHCNRHKWKFQEYPICVVQENSEEEDLGDMQPKVEIRSDHSLFT